MHDPLDGDWEGFPGDIAESIKGRLPLAYSCPKPF